MYDLLPTEDCERQVGYGVAETPDRSMSSILAGATPPSLPTCPAYTGVWVALTWSLGYLGTTRGRFAHAVDATRSPGGPGSQAAQLTEAPLEVCLLARHWGALRVQVD